MKCRVCGSYAINHHCHGRDGSDADLCDVCYWRERAESLRSTLDQEEPREDMFSQSEITKTCA
jgi:ribosome-binding protein aMBF1 (putative translation factor)